MSEEAKKKRQGFFIVPRIVRLKYRDLTYGEKWLYGCLCDLCGEGGTCFRSLRSLEVETGIALGSLGLMITHLHEAGLIQAEKKRRPGRTREIWHITIVDIWKENAEYLAQQESETDSKQEEADVDNVRKSNSNVRNSEFAHAQQCSEIEPECSKTRTERERMNKTSDLNKTHRMREGTPTVQQANTSSIVLSDEESLIHEWYAETATRATPVEINAKNKGYWKKVAAKVKTREQFISLYEYTRQVILNDPNMKKKIVHPGNLVNNLDAWHAKNETASNQQAWYGTPVEPTEHKPDEFIDGLASEITEQLGEAEQFNDLKDELSWIWQRTGALSEAGFEAMAMEELERMLAPDHETGEPMSAKDAHRFTFGECSTLSRYLSRQVRGQFGL